MFGDFKLLRKVPVYICVCIFSIILYSSQGNLSLYLFLLIMAALAAFVTSVDDTVFDISTSFLEK